MATISNTMFQTSEKTADAPSIHVRVLKFKWPGSIAFNLAFAALVGLLYSLWVMGPGPLNPRNTKWLTADPSTYQIGWELFRQDPKLHWPLTFTDRIGYPEGESVSMLDPNPLMAVLLKPFSSVLPEPFQYLGIEVILICTLQVFFALLLFRFLLGPNPLAVVLPALFFLIAPPLTYGLASGHFANSNHWLLIAALLVFCLAQRKLPGSIARFTAYSVILAGVSVAINGYIAFGVLGVLTAAIISLVGQRRLTLLRATGIVAALGATCFVAALAFGFIIAGGKGYASPGYRAYSLNMLALLDPQGHGSLLWKSLPRIYTQYEGYNYFGLGAILLAVLALPRLIRKRRNYPWFKHWIVLPLLVCCVILTLLALSTKVVFGSWTLIDLDPHEKLTPYLSTLRISARLFWTAYYTLLGTILAATFSCFRRRWAVALTSVAFVLQLADTSGLRRWAHTENNETYVSPLRSPVWSRLGSVYQNLMVMPPWQCNPDSTPGARDGYRIFGFLAAAQHMRINSYFAGRYTEVNREAQCGADISALSHGPLSPDSAYVVTYMLAQQIAQGPTGPGKCHNVDQFILCSPKTDFGLSPLVDPGELLQNPLADPGFEERDRSAWPTYQSVVADMSTAQAHSGTHSLAEKTGVGSVYQDVFGLEPGQKYTVTAWVSGTPAATATAQIAVYDPGANIAIFSTPLSPAQSWQLMSDSITIRAPGILRIHLFRNKGSGTIFWDDVHIYRER